MFTLKQSKEIQAALETADTMLTAIMQGKNFEFGTYVANLEMIRKMYNRVTREIKIFEEI